MPACGLLFCSPHVQTIVIQWGSTQSLHFFSFFNCGKNCGQFSPHCKAQLHSILNTVPKLILQNTHFGRKFSLLNSFEAFCRGWRDGSAIKNTGCSCRSPAFSSQHPLGGSLQFLTTIPGYLAPSSGICGHHAHVMHRHTHRQMDT